MSLNQWIAAAVAEKAGVVEAAADFFKKWTGKAIGEGLVRFLRTAPKATPDAEDALCARRSRTPPKRRARTGTPCGIQMIAMGRAIRLF